MDQTSIENEQTEFMVDHVVQNRSLDYHTLIEIDVGFGTSNRPSIPSFVATVTIYDGTGVLPGNYQKTSKAKD